ncbi:MAG: aminodeoxychorismate synthase component I [Candidatus Omnitrophica bacterium]|nr:aminodeoxychorismate synthase component I [Candidatus Omnitrophota bacterium]MDD5237295.1 aminodeoxychorismate synthase component I [Candidatus Omnitrophota bacterium]MDD5611137.1 aminodeoxychorismate synthase component I [Candidatus Omnitrophota bacterium]
MGYCTWKSYNFNHGALPIFQALKEERNCFFLDSGINNSLGRYSFLGCAPFQVLKVKKSDPFKELDGVLKRNRIKPFKNAPPFLGGAVGFLSYDFGLLLENKLKNLYGATPNIPDAYFAFYDTVIAVDHFKNKLFVLSISPHGEKQITRLLSGINFKERKVCPRPGQSITPVSNFTKKNYLRSVAKAKDYISKGDIYQVNLSQQFTAKSSLAADKIYENLRKASPASFSAYLDCGDFQIISSSPERFLSLRHGLVQTRPMKGTRPRAEDKKQDKRLQRELLDSAKDKAELMMITDLMRNDLGRVCEYSSIKVRSLRNLEKYKTVFQTTATIEGVLHRGMRGVDLVKACFPGGSITGCPKIRAMEIIRELEPAPRNIYTGSLGYLSFCGNLDFNILIRTILKQGDDLSFSVGGGIVADSSPEAEYKETLVKAKGMLRAIS